MSPFRWLRKRRARRARSKIGKPARDAILVPTPEWRGVDLDDSLRESWQPLFEVPPRPPGAPGPSS